MDLQEFRHLVAESGARCKMIPGSRLCTEGDQDDHGCTTVVVLVPNRFAVTVDIDGYGKTISWQPPEEMWAEAQEWAKAHKFDSPDYRWESNLSTAAVKAVVL